jgi:hypothetical protein
MHESHVKMKAMLSILFVSLSVNSCTNVTRESGAILWNYKIGGQLWAPANYGHR